MVLFKAKSTKIERFWPYAQYKNIRFYKVEPNKDFIKTPFVNIYLEIYLTVWTQLIPMVLI